MTVAAPGDDAPVTQGLLDFVFAEIWSRPGIEPPRPSIRDPVAAADFEPISATTCTPRSTVAISPSPRCGGGTAFRGLRGLAQSVAVSTASSTSSGTASTATADSPPAARAAAAATHTSEPEARLAVGEESFRTINCLPFAPSLGQPVLRRGHP